MRISADPEDPDFSPAAARLQVFLDGALVPACITADDVRGEVLAYDIDAKGYLCTSASVHRGRVEILVDPRCKPAERRLTAEQLARRYAGGDVINKPTEAVNS